MNLNFNDILRGAIILFPIIDMIGNLPIIISLHKKVGSINSEKSIFVATLIMIIFLFLGQSILNFMEIPIESFAVGGSLILFILAIEMLLGVSFHKTDIPNSVSIIPIAFPLIAGPGVLTTVLSMRASYSVENIIGSILVNMAIAYAIMKMVKPIGRALGETGVVIVHKICGIILLALSINMFANNWKLLMN